MNENEEEKLLRKIEWKRLFIDPRSSFSLEEIRHISEIFICRSESSGDWRFLNAAMKLNDWLRTGGHTTERLDRLEELALKKLRAECGLKNPAGFLF
jgi:hypothetical protein